MPDLTKETKALLNKLGAAARKKLGQNFMVSGEALEAVAAALPSSPETVVEIGPGLGFLTRLLTEKFPLVIAIEKDAAYAAHLKSAFPGKEFQVFEKDVLKLNLRKDLGLGGPMQVAGNIPYNITSPILEWLIEERKSVRHAVLTVQWEVAERLAAKPGNKIWGSLSIFVQTYAKVTLVRRVGRGSFWPAPKVDSAVVRLDFSEKPLVDVRDEVLFFKIVRRAFQKRRKTIANALADKEGAPFGKEALSKTLAACGIDSGRRPETLALEEWARLANAF